MRLAKSIALRWGLALFAALLGIMAAVYFRGDLLALWAYATTDRSPPAVFAGALVVLPALGFPLSPLLILMGGRFGWAPGLAGLALVVPIHLMVAFLVSRRVLFHRLCALAARRGVDLSSPPLSGRIKASLLFMALPGLSYSLKNYLLPLSGLPARYCLALGWPVQVLLGIPFIIFGSAAANWSLPMMAGALVMAAVFIAASRPAARIFKHLIRNPHQKKKEKEERCP